MTPGTDHVISKGLRFAVNVKLNVSNSDNRETSQHPKWWHAEKPNFKIADICF